MSTGRLLLIISLTLQLGIITTGVLTSGVVSTLTMRLASLGCLACVCCLAYLDWSNQ